LVVGVTQTIVILHGSFTVTPIRIPHSGLMQSMTTIKSVEEIYIYESPDGGKTIYRRVSGSTNREMIQEDPERKYIDQWNDWREILKLARDNVTLRDAVERAEMIYNLIKDENH